jgi:hypothetical protein
LTAEGLEVAEKQSAEPLKPGDWVKIRHSGFKRARVVGLLGPLGPGGAQIYRVRVSSKPLKPIYIELLGDQLVLIPPKSDPAAQREHPAADAPSRTPDRGGGGDG